MTLSAVPFPDAKDLPMPRLSTHPRLATAALAALISAGLCLPSARAGEDGSCGSCDSAAASPQAQFVSADDAAMPATRPTQTADEMLADMKAITGPKFDPAKREDEAYVKAYVAERSAAVAKQTQLAEQFVASYPRHEQAPQMLMMAAQMSDDDAHAVDLYRKLAADYPQSPMAERAKGQVRRADGVGKPFEISFNDVTSGQTVSSDTLKGKVVVVDFWATWCGPCVAELPTMKKIYADFHDKGVEFVGVSLDQSEAKGGKQKLIDFVAKNDMAWPQFYQGNYWQSEFSSSWGINSIPALFVVDADGNLFSTEARGKLEEILPELIAKRDAAKAQTAGGEQPAGGM